MPHFWAYRCHSRLRFSPFPVSVMDALWEVLWSESEDSASANDPDSCSSSSESGSMSVVSETSSSPVDEVASVATVFCSSLLGVVVTVSAMPCSSLLGGDVSSDPECPLWLSADDPS